jgi:hypothetical protein
MGLDDDDVQMIVSKVEALACDVAGAWALLHDPAKVTPGQQHTLTALLDELGASSAEDLLVCTEDRLSKMTGCLKVLAAAQFMEKMTKR